MRSSTSSHLQFNPIPAAGNLRSFLSKHWFLAVSLVLGLYVGLPFLAPVFMRNGGHGLGKGIYFIYSFLCHQLPERSFFLFGPQISYSLAELRATGVNTADILQLRQFIGNPEMGWKVAWSDRMVSMYTSILIFGLVWRPLRRWIPKLPWWGFVLLLLPMAIDGTSHLISDLAGFGQGFRDSNTWLAAVTNQAYTSGFYAGDAVGSFNFWIRLLTGIFFGLGIVWFSFPYIDEALLAPIRPTQRRSEMDRVFLERFSENVKDTST